MTSAALDPALVTAANEQFWTSHPKLHRRQLVMPQDSGYAMEWQQEYKAAQKAKFATSLVPPAGVTPFTPAPLMSVPTYSAGTVLATQPCLSVPPCGDGSKKCVDALAGKDASGKPIPEGDLERIKASHEKMTTRRKQAKFLGYERAVAALDHWFGGCGKFFTIPADKTKEVRVKSESTHVSKLKPKLSAALPDRLAYELSTLNSTPNVVEFDLDWKGGGEASTIPMGDDDLAYNGATIHSRVRYRCARDKTAVVKIAYFCDAVKWISWVEDNYDFEDGKKTAFLPDDADMNLLARYGCGENYQRSSNSWTSDASSLAQTVLIGSGAEFKDLVHKREAKMIDEAQTRADEQSGGALLSAEPAETY